MRARRKRLATFVGAGATLIVTITGVAFAGSTGLRSSEAGPVWNPLVSNATPSPIDRLSVAGRPEFWAGLNYPWKTGQDFGTGGWGHSGVSDATTYQEIDADFANMAAQGVRVVKWRVFSDGRYGLEFGSDGSVTGLDDLVLPDIDAALEIAQRHDVYLVLTLFSSGFWTADCRSDNVQLGGHANTKVAQATRQSLIDKAIVPLVEHVANSDRVIAYEIIAEPEWGIQELNQEVDQRIKLPLSDLQTFVTQVATSIHKHSAALATVESNRFSNMQYWRGTGVDYYSFSWYDWLEPYEPLATPASSANLDRPIVLGEYPAGGSSYYDIPQVLDTVYSLGYAGAFGWSYWAGDGISHWRDVAPTFSSWVAGRWSELNLGGVAQVPASGPIQEQAYPYSIQGLALHVDGNAVVAEMKIDVPSGEAYVPHAYLYQIGNAQPLEEVRLTAAPGQPGKLDARFMTATEGPAYSLSLGIFDPAGTLRKWFNGISTFALANGTLTTPKVDTLTSELGCGA
jgi:hypothetical protein